MAPIFICQNLTDQVLLVWLPGLVSVADVGDLSGHLLGIRQVFVPPWW